MPKPPPASPLSTTHAPLTVRVPVVTDEHPDSPRDASLSLKDVRRSAIEDGVQPLTFVTSAGEFPARYHPVTPSTAQPLRAVVCVGGAGGGLDGPAAGLYPAVCTAVQHAGMAGLRIHYRHPNNLPACILDTMLAVLFLRSEGADRVALLGHSFGGAVVISAGALSADVTAVVPMSTQTYGADLAPQVSPRPMLLIHGTADEVLPHICSELVFAAAREPKELKLLPGATHGLDRARDELLTLLPRWLEENT